MDQPYSRMADMLLDKQYYNPNDPSPYDDTGWTLGPLFNVTTDRIDDTAILQARMEKVTGTVMTSRRGGGAGNASAYVIAYGGRGESGLVPLCPPRSEYPGRRGRLRGWRTSLRRGSLRHTGRRQLQESRGRAETAATEFGFVARGVDAVPDVAMHPVAGPPGGGDAQLVQHPAGGWLRIGMDEYKIPYDYISVHEIRDIAESQGPVGRHRHRRRRRRRPLSDERPPGQ